MRANLAAVTAYLIGGLVCPPALPGRALPQATSAPDTPFVQEYHVPHPLPGGRSANDVLAVAVDSAGGVWAGTAAGAFTLPAGASAWERVPLPGERGPVFDAAVDAGGVVWLAAWNGLYRTVADSLQALRKTGGIDAPVAALGVQGVVIFAAGPDGLWRLENGQAVRLRARTARSMRAVLPDTGGLWLGTEMGLFRIAGGRCDWHIDRDALLSPYVQTLAHDGRGDLWIGGLGGITIYRNGRKQRTLTAKDGLPNSEVTALALAPDGTMWIGTRLGVVRYAEGRWSLRHSKRWLLSDAVRDITFDRAGTAWIATAAGISAMRRRVWTLADKARYFLDICLRRHVREPGLVGKCGLESPGDTSAWVPRDDDNDGQYTAMYLAMETYRYAATKSPDARAHATRAFEALQFLQEVTGTGDFIARTVIPASWTQMADPNRRYSAPDWARARVRNPREKRVGQRWRLSADGKWRWKGDTSSDELTGHMFGYLCFYDLAADAQQKQRVARHVQKIVDGLIDGGLVLRDLDGSHTKWGVWAPEMLNLDPDWHAERGMNSVEILSFLKVAFHMTGDRKYERLYRELLFKHGYAENVRRAKNTNPSLRTHIDDELLALAYPGLILYEKDPALQQLYRESLENWHAIVEADRSPYFNFVHAFLSGSVKNLDDSIFFLRDAPLDLVYWRVDNSQREDLQLTREPEWESWQTSRLLPPSERGVIRWDNNPWRAVQGDGGYTESTGVSWLLPYWMGRYYGYLQPPVARREPKR